MLKRKCHHRVNQKTNQRTTKDTHIYRIPRTYKSQYGIYSVVPGKWYKKSKWREKVNIERSSLPETPPIILLLAMLQVLTLTTFPYWRKCLCVFMSVYIEKSTERCIWYLFHFLSFFLSFFRVRVILICSPTMFAALDWPEWLIQDDINCRKIAQR